MPTQLNHLNGKEWLQYSFSIWRDLNKTSDERKMEHPAIFPVDLAKRLIEIFTREGDTILDPFSGSGSTAIASIQSNRNFMGVELSEKYVKLTNERINHLNKHNVTAQTFCNDSTKLSQILGNAKIDFCLTSPPYWNILNQKRTADHKQSVQYGSSNKDLGNIDDYEEFLNRLKTVFLQTYTILNDNKYCVVVVMDIRKKKNFFPLHMDIVNMMRDIGFVFDDMIIWDRQKEYNNMKPLGFPSVFRINKVHEFVLIFKKVKS